jgi:hypothetical protein
MNEKSANQGDRLKHALLLEVLERAQTWPDVTYAETHAGAAIYRAEGQAAQKPDKQYIRLLREEVERSHLAEGDNEPGAAYLGWLKEWWLAPSKDGTYPGSALTALHWLREHHAERFELRLTEGGEATCKQLKEELGEAYRDQAKHGSFHDHLDWLTERENLILLVDPFGIVKEFDPGRSSDGLRTGKIDHEVVRKILNRCLSKERAIVLFWWSSGQKLAEHHEATSRLLEQWGDEHSRVSYRQFHDGRYNHKLGLMGISGGAGIVSGIPGRDDWARAWLKNVIYEKGHKRPK